MIAALPYRRSLIGAHVRAIVGTFVLVLLGAAGLHYDRRAPFEYVNTTIEPAIAKEGETVTVHRHVIWRRACDGEIFKEVVKPGGQIVAYDTRYRPFPYSLGAQSARSQFELPMAMLPPEQAQGVALYRGRVRFSACGLTSRFVPLEIPFQEVAFPISH